MPTVQPLDEFSIPNVLRFEDGSGGLVRAVISTSQAEADLYLQGAHLTHWTLRGQQPVLFVSPTSLFSPGKAIRGGVPIIFPWFGPRGEGMPGPAHGFARTMNWEVENARQSEDGKVEITLILPADDNMRSLFSTFQLRFRVTLGAELEMELETRNPTDRPFTYEEALHTYFSIGDIHHISISGLEGTTCIDKANGFKRKVTDNEPIRLTKEIDQMHIHTKATCVIHDPAWNRRIVIEKSGSESTVVWNPWREKTLNMTDMAADSWGKMICVETANAADNAITLAPKASHKLVVRISLEPF